MLEPVLIAACMVLVGVSNAAMDKLTHHWHRSIFKRLAKGDKLSFWGPASITWLRKYVDHSSSMGVRPVFKIPVIGMLYGMVYDAWHLAQTIMWLSMFAAVAVAGSSAWLFALCYVAALGAFKLFYLKIL